MKKVFCFLLLLTCIFTLFACGKTIESEVASESKIESVVESVEHVHDFTKILEKKSTCTKKGNIEHFYCKKCKKYYLDVDGTTEITYEQTKTEKAKHDTEKITGYPATCGKAGIKDHWVCKVCENTFADEDCTKSIVGSDKEIPPLSHSLVYVAEIPVTMEENGRLEHWQCEECGALYLDEQAQRAVKQEDLIIYTLMKIPDFIIDVPSGVDPVVLQLTDTQIIDGEQLPQDAASGDKYTYAREKIKGYCYDYVTEIITETKPHLILITGDLIYGKYDDSGWLLLSFISFMDSFKIPWAPVFGNHENESAMGSDWQSQQLENAEYCLFKQRQLTGNGNYSVAIRQGDKLTRVFYMLDTNGCNYMSDQSFANGHTTASVGFGADQVEWYTNQITRLKELSPDTKISFAYHIQQAVFASALNKYGFNQSEKYQDIYVDYLENKADGDFGYIGRQMKDPWDSSREIFNGMKALGVDSVFVGHEHCNSVSVVYEGIRFQYGQKSSEYDRYNGAYSNGKITATAVYEKDNSAKTPLVGGSVVVFSKADGTIKNAYIYYCKTAGQNVDFSTAY